MPIRLAVPSDGESIARVHVLAWQETYEGLMPQDFLNSLSVSQRLGRWTEVLSMPSQSGLSCVALDGAGQICGFAHLGVARDAVLAGIPELYCIYILRANQRCGLGLGMVACLASARAAQGNSSHEFYAWVLRDNRAVSWYQKMGGRKVNQKTTTIGGRSLLEDAYVIPWPKGS